MEPHCELRVGKRQDSSSTGDSLLRRRSTNAIFPAFTKLLNYLIVILERAGWDLRSVRRQTRSAMGWRKKVVALLHKLLSRHGRVGRLVHHLQPPTVNSNSLVIVV